MYVIMKTMCVPSWLSQQKHDGFVATHSGGNREREGESTLFS